MKFYVAGKWQDRYTIRWLQQELMSRGHSISCDWTNHDFDKNGVKATKYQLIKIAEEDARGVKDCDIYVGILLSEYSYKGLWVEMGMAIALKKKVYAIGEAGDSCIFMNHPSVQRFRTMEDFLGFIDREFIKEEQK